VIRRFAPLAAVVVLGLAFRLVIVHQFRTTTPDADQYCDLSNSLLRDGSYAFGPEPARLTHSRMPGYPLFMAAVDGRVSTAETFVHRATVANALLDVATAVFVWLILRDRKSRAALAGAVAVLLYPVLILASVSALTESLSTFLATVAVWALLRLIERRHLGYAVVAGVVTGLALLVRIDAVSLLPAVGLAALWIADARTRRRGLIVALATATIVFSPWPLRNRLRFGQPYPAGTEWPSQNGTPLPTGPISWMRTWSASQPGDAAIHDLMTFGQRFGAARITDRMYDSDEEKAHLVMLLSLYEEIGLAPTVNAAFEDLAVERARAHPFRTWVVLPLRRLVSLLNPPGARATHFVHIPLLGLPRTYPMFPISTACLYLLALLGGFTLWRARAWGILLVVASPVLARMAIHAYAVPYDVSFRYFVEAIPMLVVLACSIRRRAS
jgi:4-amino-4-deoxy-L-arabinose transferase-like glycosyltransferase